MPTHGRLRLVRIMSIHTRLPSATEGQPSGWPPSQRRDRIESLLRDLSSDPPRDERASLIEELVQLNLSLCDGVAGRYAGRGIDRDDLVQVARLALVKAILGYRPEPGRNFAAYAVPTIRGEIKRHFRDHGWMIRPPRRLQELCTEVRAARVRLEQDLGRSPNVQEVAWHLDIEIGCVQACLLAGTGYNLVSLDAPVGQDGPETLSAVIADDRDDYGHVDDRMSLALAIVTLSDRERRLLVLRFVEGLTQEQIGHLMGVSQMQVSRLLAATIGRLREAIGVGLESPGEESEGRSGEGDQGDRGRRRLG